MRCARNNDPVSSNRCRRWRSPSLTSPPGRTTRTLNRRFREQTGTTPHQWLLRARVQRAQELLEHSELPVERIAEQVGFASAMPLRETLAAFAATRATLVLHLSIQALDPVVAELMPSYGVDCPIAVVVRATWPDERIVRATLGTILQEIAKEPPERSALIIVGRALGSEDFRASALYDANYRRRYRAGVQS